MSVEPNAFDDKALADIRANQEDPIQQYYIVKSDANMTLGKICTQVAHGAQMFILGYHNICNIQVPIDTNRKLKKDITEQWLNGSFRKIFVKAKTKDFEKIKEALDVFVVRDAGLTEVEPGTETLIVTWPMHKSSAPKILQRLRLFTELSSNNNG